MNTKKQQKPTPCELTRRPKHDAEFERGMEVARKVMHDRRAALRELAKR